MPTPAPMATAAAVTKASRALAPAGNIISPERIAYRVGDRYSGHERHDTADDDRIHIQCRNPHFKSCGCHGNARRAEDIQDKTADPDSLPDLVMRTARMIPTAAEAAISRNPPPNSGANPGRDEHGRKIIDPDRYTVCL